MPTITTKGLDLRRRFGRLMPSWVSGLVRPDGYVALAAKRDAINEVDVYLANLSKVAAASAA
jgi:hypothetical protein